MNMDISDDRFRDIIDVTRDIEQLATGFQFTEGPVWHPGTRELVFSDMPGDCMRRYTPERGIEVYRKPSNMANGNTFDRQGRLLTCEHASSRVTSTLADGSIQVVASHYNGLELNSPNDIVVKRDGSIYFTDPDFGRSIVDLGFVKEIAIAGDRVSFAIELTTPETRSLPDSHDMCQMSTSRRSWPR